MDYSLFNLGNFNVIEDNEYYYVFRALNSADHDDVIDHFIETAKDPERIRTDRERFEKKYGRAKYNKDSELSLEEMYDHIKIHYLKETNCISLSSNSCVSLDYGGSYHDEYAVIRVPKDDSNPNISHAGQYMLYEIFLKIEEALAIETIDDNTKKIIDYINRCNSNKEIIETVSSLIKDVRYAKNILSRFQNRQYFNEQQQLEYNKIVAKASILEITGILPSIIKTNHDNQSLLATIGMAFSSGEMVYYKDIPKENFSFISKKMLNLFSIVQQLKEKFPNKPDVTLLEKRLIELFNNGYDIRNINGKVVITNGNDTISSGLTSLDTEIFNKSKLDPYIMSIEEIYNITGGTISYDKAKKAVEFCYTLASSRKEVYDYALIISSILGNTNLMNEVLNQCFIIDSKIIDRSNNNGHKICESVNIGLDNKAFKQYTLEEQNTLIRLIQELDLNNIEMILENEGPVFRNRIIEHFEKGPVVSKNEYYATSIIDSIDFTKIYREEVKDDYLTETKAKLSKLLSNSNISRLYKSFTNLELSHEEISYYIFNLFIEKRLKGYTFDEICELDYLDNFIKENFSVFNRDVNSLTLNNYLGIFTDSNYIPNSEICLRDFQQRIKNDVDRIHSSNKRFAGVVLPTGGGKSFIALAEMMDRRDSKIIYIAPRKEILRNFKKNIVKYVAGVNPEGLSEEELNIIVRDCFPHLELICYQGLDPQDEQKLASYKADYIILDEIHHIGGPSWNRVIKKLVDNNPKSQVLGISATPQRDEYVEHNGEDYFNMYGGDMMMAMAAYLDNYTADELMQKTYLACDINIIDAIQEGYVICPNIISFDYSLDETYEYKKVLGVAKQIKEPTTKKRALEEVELMLSLVNKAKLNGVDTIINEHIKVKDGKYILFIPRKPHGYEGTTDEYIEECIEDFKLDIADIDSNPHIDYIHSGRNPKINQKVMRNFELDNSEHIKVLVAIDMLNEGVHLPNINGSFNFRKIDSEHLILSLQHLGRVIYALDPSKEYTEYDTPVVFDKFNNYSNLDMDRLVNKKTVTSDLEKLKDALFWIDKYGRYPSVNSQVHQEVKKAITLKRIQEKYQKFINVDLNKYNLSEYDKTNTKKIIELCNEYNIWNIEFGELSREQRRKLDRVQLFNVSAIQRQFIEICNRINEMAGISHLKSLDRINLLLKVLDILCENDVVLTPETIRIDTELGDLLEHINDYDYELINYELTKLGISNNYPIGQEFYSTRNALYTSRSIFNNYTYNFEEITMLRKYGILYNGNDYKFIDERGFVINGPKKLLRKNILTGTYYAKDGGDIEYYDQYHFHIETKLHKETNSKYNKHGFDITQKHKDTGDIYDIHGFDINCLHRETGTIHNPKGFDISGNWYRKDPETNEYKENTHTKYDESGFDIDNYNRKGFDRNGIHRITGKEYDEQYFGNDDMYWEISHNGQRRKTNHVYNDKMFDRKGFLYEIDPKTGKAIKKGQIYNKYGFLANGIHHRTMTTLDPAGFDIDGFWHRKQADGTYINTGSMFNDKGWNRDKETLRHNVYGVTQRENGEMFLDIVDDYGFDYRGKYHRPVDEIDRDGFVEFHKDVILYTDKYYHRNNIQGTYYDIHGFDINGIHSKTGTFLNTYNFDRNGYYWKTDDHGKLYNTYSYFNEDGWTIDKRKFIYTKFRERVYSPIDERGFTIDHLYKPSLHIPSKIYDDNGFDYNGINYATGTHIDEEGFDRDGIWWTTDENGKLVKTNSRYNSEGWSRQHVHEKTSHIRDEHGFDYLHLYRYPSSGKNREGKLSEYDPNNFNYLGIHKITGKPYNKNHFDIDGYWYKKVDGKYIKTDSKYDDEGLDIHRRDKHGFSKNGNYLGGRRKYNDQGFLVNGINIYTNRDFDLDGNTIDGEPSPNVDWNLIREVQKQHIFDRRRYIEDIIAENSWYQDLLETYNEDTDEFEELFGELDMFIALVQATGITESEDIYTEEEILEYMKRDARARRRATHYKEIRDIYMSTEYSRLIEEGELPAADYNEIYRLY